MEKEVKAADKKLVWIPNKGLGDILIGRKVEDYTNSYRLVQSDKDYDNEYDRKTFMAPEWGVDIITDKEGVITSIDVDKEFYYKNQNVIGMNVKDAIKMFGGEPDEKSGPYVFDNDYAVTSYDYLKLGLLLWVNNNNKVDSITCSDTYL